MNETNKCRLFKVNVIFLLLMIIIELMTVVVPMDFLIKYDQYVRILLPVIMIALFLKLNIVERFKLKKFKITTVFYCILLTLCIFPITSYLGGLTELFWGKNPYGVNEMIQSLDMSPMYLLFFIAITPALCEELMHRGLLLDIKAGVSMHHLALLSGIMFSLFHVNYDQLLYTFAMGIILAYVAIITGSIFPAMLIHFLNNSVSVLGQVMMSGFSAEELAEVSSDAVTTFADLPNPILPVIAIVCIVFIMKRLIKVYAYDDKKRLASCEEDIECFNRSNKIAVFWPIFIVFIYVVLSNILLKVGGV